MAAALLDVAQHARLLGGRPHGGLGHFARRFGKGQQDVGFRLDGLDDHQAAAVADQVELPGRRVGQVDDAVVQERAAVVHAQHDGLARLRTGNADIGGNRQRRVGGGHAEHVVGLAAGGFLAMELAAIPAGDALLAKGRRRLQRHVVAAEHRVGPVGESVQGLRARHGVGHAGEVDRNLVGGAIVLVKAAAALEGVAGLRLHRNSRR